jgi:hypothetical protein
VINGTAIMPEQFPRSPYEMVGGLVFFRRRKVRFYFGENQPALDLCFLGCILFKNQSSWPL